MSPVPFEKTGLNPTGSYSRVKIKVFFNNIEKGEPRN